jgi:hypothetical protein
VIGDRALGEELHTGKGEVLVKCGDILLVAGQAVERFRDHDVEGGGDSFQRSGSSSIVSRN